MLIKFSPPDITELEINAVTDALRSGRITTGPRTRELEARLSAYVGTERTVCLSSATAALELALRVLGIGEGDEVIVPAYTYTASASPVLHVGATLRLIDVARGSFHMDYDALSAAITEKTKAVIPVDVGGVPCDYARIYATLEEKKHLFTPRNEREALLGRPYVIADCAHALGALLGGIRAGALADLSILSFTEGERTGSAITWREAEGLDSDGLYRELSLLSLAADTRNDPEGVLCGAWEYDALSPAYKCNMTDAQASIGLARLSRCDAMLARRHEIVAYYDAAFAELGIRTLRHTGEGLYSSAHLYLTHIPDTFDGRRRAFMDYMAKAGVVTNVHYKPLPMMTAYRALGFDINDFPNAYCSYQGEITLPLYASLTDEEVAFIASTFRQCITTI